MKLSKNDNKVGLKIMVTKEERQIIKTLAAKKGKTMQQLYEDYIELMIEEAERMGLK